MKGCSCNSSEYKTGGCYNSRKLGIPISPWEKMTLGKHMTAEVPDINHRSLQHGEHASKSGCYFTIDSAYDKGVPPYVIKNCPLDKSCNK